MGTSVSLEASDCENSHRQNVNAAVAAEHGRSIIFVPSDVRRSLAYVPRCRHRAIHLGGLYCAFLRRHVDFLARLFRDCWPCPCSCVGEQPLRSPRRTSFLRSRVHFEVSSCVEVARAWSLEWVLKRVVGPFGLTCKCDDSFAANSRKATRFLVATYFATVRTWSTEYLPLPNISRPRTNEPLHCVILID